MQLVKLVKLVKLISVYCFDIFTSKKAQNPQFFTLLTSKCASRHNGVHFFDTFSTSEPPKVVRTPSVLYILTWKCASRHNGVHFFDIATSKSGPTLVCFVHFDFKMCFAPQRRALFRHRNFQKWSDIGVLCTFWLQNVLRATTACTFSTSQLPKVVRSSSVLSILTWKCASRHNGVHFFMSHLASWLRTRRFSEPTFRPSGATNHWKNTVNRDFPIFSRIYLFFLLIFSLLTLFTSAFQLSILSEVSLLNFLRWCYMFIFIIVYILFRSGVWCHRFGLDFMYYCCIWPWGSLIAPANRWNRESHLQRMQKFHNSRVICATAWFRAPGFHWIYHAVAYTKPIKPCHGIHGCLDVDIGTVLLHEAGELPVDPVHVLQVAQMATRRPKFRPF